MLIRDKRKQPSRHMMDLWRQRVAAVLKYDYEKPAPLDPIKVLHVERMRNCVVNVHRAQIVVIDRHYTDRNGRAVLNMRQVFKRIIKRCAMITCTYCV